MMPGRVLEFVPLAATLFAVPQFLPQLVKVWRSGDVSGVSWGWAALTSVNNSAWAVYFVLSGHWTALVPALSAVVLAGALAVLLGWRGGLSAPAMALTGAGAVLLAGALGLGGRVWLGTALTAGFVLQVTPSLWTAYRTHRPTGISRGTWLLILGELLCWAIYGLYASDPRLIALGCTGVAASILMLAATHGHIAHPAQPSHSSPTRSGATTAHRNAAEQRQRYHET